MSKVVPLKVLMVNTFANFGGASIACNRLIESLNEFEEELEVNLLVLIDSKEIKSTQMGSNINFYLEKIKFLFSEKSSNVRFAFSTAEFGIDITKHPIFKGSDIIHLHWINQGFLSLKVIQKILLSKKKVFWTFHDMWPFTGGCHHSGLCNEYRRSCGNCNQFLKYPSANDLSNRIHKEKSEIELIETINVVSISKWMKEKIMVSSLFKNNTIYEIPNPINRLIFHKKNISDFESDKVGLDRKAIKILFVGAKIDNYFKGFGLFLDFLKELKLENESIQVLLVGDIKKENLDKIPFNVIHFGLINNDYLMANIYNYADLFISTSENESFSYTCLESMSCHTPILAFNTGEISNFINHKNNGYLIEKYNLESFIKAYYWFKNDYNSSLAKWENLNIYSYVSVGSNLLKAYMN